jgi:hypothetical protein
MAGLSLNSNPYVIDPEILKRLMANMQTPQPQGYQGALPQISSGGGSALVSGSGSMDLGGGLSAEGQYNRSNVMSPAEWQAMLRYSQQF